MLTGDVYGHGGGRLIIEPGVKVMPTGNYGDLEGDFSKIFLSFFFSGLRFYLAIDKG